MLTEQVRNKVLDLVFRGVAYTPPTTVYIGLHTNTSEVSGMGYKRMPITFGAATSGTLKNTAEVRFPIAGVSWGTVTKLAIYDAETVGNRLDELTLTPDKVKDIGKNEQPLIPVGGYDTGLIECV